MYAGWFSVLDKSDIASDKATEHCNRRSLTVCYSSLNLLSSVKLFQNLKTFQNERWIKYFKAVFLLNSGNIFYDFALQLIYSTFLVTISFISLPPYWEGADARIY